MNHWLLKTEPSEFSFDDLVHQKKATWDGVSNALALRHIRSMKKGDFALIYHTGTERAIIGVAQITSAPYPDPKQDDERLVVVDLKPRTRLGSPVTLDTIKADPIFKDWELLRISRLSIMPVPPKLWTRIETLARTGAK